MAQQSYELENGTANGNGNRNGIIKNQDQTPHEIELKKIELTNSLSSAEKGASEKEKFIEKTGSGIPIDKKKLVYIIFIIHGIGNLMPWNMFITAKPYFMNYKLNVTLDDSVQNDILAVYREKFISIASISSQVPNLLFNGLNLFLAYYSSNTGGVNLFKLITGSIIVNILIMTFTILLVLLDTTTYPIRFFFFTIVSIVFLNISNGFYQNSIYGAAAKLPDTYSNAVVFGNNICGTIVSFINIVTVIISPNLKYAAFFYFSSAIVILVACLITFKQLLNNKFYQHFSRIQKGGNATRARPSYIYILKHCGEQCLNVFLTFFVTLLLFPTVLSSIQPSGNLISTDFFTPVFCFFNFNLFAMIGNILPNYFKVPSPKRLWIPVCLRILFIPFFLYCNFKNDVYPTYFGNDLYFIVGTMLVGLSHGYLSSLGMMYAPKTVADEHSPIAGMLSAFCLICGITSGVSASILL